MDGTISANINKSKYLLIIDGGNVDCFVDEATRVALWILNPKINDDVSIKKETVARIFPKTWYQCYRYTLPCLLCLLFCSYRIIITVHT
jgi:hypothetical protein